MDKIKVRMGQVWRVNGNNYILIRIEVWDGIDRLVIGKRQTDGIEGGFGCIDQDDYPVWNTTDYPLVKDVITTLLDFFKAVPEGHCACGIPVAQCKYHGSSKV